MKKNIFSLSEIKSLIVKCIQEGVGDDTRECLQKEEIAWEYSNAKNTLKWDYINRNLLETFKDSNLHIKIVNRGPWKMVLMLDNHSGIMYTIMRKERFKEIRKEQLGRKRPHYLDALAIIFGANESREEQICMFGNEFFEEKDIINVILKLLNGASLEFGDIQGYRVILFEEHKGELLSITCCSINPDLKVVNQDDWSHYITHNISTIVEQNENGDIVNDIELTLTNKAKEKISESDKMISLKTDNIRKIGE